MAKRILIIEDEKVLIEMYRDRFLKDGFQPIIATSAQEGLEAAKRELPDIILLDILLGDENGISFLKKRLQHKESASIPVIAFSNFNDPETKKQAFALGALEYLLKTDYTPQQIVDKIRLYVK